MKKTVHYVNNQKFLEEIIKYRERLKEAELQGKDAPRMPDYIGECIMKIANKLSTKPGFINYSYREEMISDGIENAIMYFHDYDPEKGQNPFAYFTQIIYYAFLRRLKKEEKNRYIIYKNFQHTIIHGQQGGEYGNHDVTSVMNDSDNNYSVPMSMYDNINDFMDKFEKKEEAMKVERKKKKEKLQKFYGADDEGQ